MSTIDIVVPCYNEEEGLAHFVEVTNSVIDTIPQHKFRYILVNDGSRDKTYLVMKQLAEKYSNIKYISFSRNFGKEAAMYAGLSNASGDYVTIIDADLQQRPEVVLEMVKILDENEEYDSVAAFQQERKEGKAMVAMKNTFYNFL